MKLTFWGGARHVTGANYLLETDTAKILVDCGLIQGCHFCERRNLRPFPYDPERINALLLTHAHIDHTGRVPRLVRDGFQGTIFATPPTLDFASLLLEDSQDLLEAEARERGFEPPYAQKDLARTKEQFRPLVYNESASVAPGVTVTLHDAGHVLGSAIIEVDAEGKKIIFSGDIGNPSVSFLNPPARLPRADYVVMESTYGDRVHEKEKDRKDLLEDAVEDVVKRRGTLMIPAFSFERTQELLFDLNGLVEGKKIAALPVFVDSPLAIRVTELYQRYRNYYGKEAQERLAQGDDLLRFPGLRFTETVAQSKAINDAPQPKVVIAGSGMMTGGRILHHARRYLPDEKSTLLIVGYQVAGSLGRRLLKGEKRVKIFNENIEVRSEIRVLSNYSAHADKEELVRWVDNFARPVKKVFAVQGEEGPALALVQHIRDHLGLDASAPMLGDTAEL